MKRLGLCALLAACCLTTARAEIGTPPGPNLLPPHASICSGNRVHKVFLLGFLRTKFSNAKNQDAQVLTGTSTESQARLFTDDPSAFCALATKPLCGTGADPKDCKAAVDSCLAYKQDAVNAAHYFFQNLNREDAKSSATYKESTGLRGGQAFEQTNKYFDYKTINQDDVNYIECTSVKVDPSPSTAQADSSPLGRIRVRGRSDDLYVDRATPQFKSTTPASVNLTGSGFNNYSQKLTSVLGYKLDVGTDGQFIPYVSTSQSVTDAPKKPRVIDPTNNVAGGFLATTFFGDPNNEYVQHVITAKPQYLLNTADQSELTSLRLIYAPWTDIPNIPFNTNTYHLIPIFPGPVWGSWIFDLRNDTGAYEDRGNTRTIVATNQDFDRFGTRAGLVLTTDPAFPSLTMTVTETYLYGFVGHYKKLDLFEASVTYNLESNNYFGLTASYKHGRDEDTAVAAQTWTVGLTTRY